MDGFNLFWAAWPRSTRKGAKSACLQKWCKNYNETQADQILKHVAWMKTTEDWLKNNGAFIPAPLVYLNQQRWDGADVPDVGKSAAEQTIERMNEDAKAVTAPSPEMRLQLAALKKRLTSLPS